MIDRQRNRIVIECDACGNVHEGKSSEWNEVWPEARRRVNFGKHRGQAWSTLPPDYLSWLVNKSDMDADTKFTARHWLERRRKGLQP